MARTGTSGARPRIDALTGDSIAMFFSQPRERQAESAVFLDRDGVINEKIDGGYVTGPDSFRFVPGILGALSELSAAPYPIIVVSNQAAVAKGLITRAVLEELTRHFVAQLQQSAARIDAVYYCPHTPEMNCHCRKPRAGLLERAAAEWGVSLKRSVLVGDSLSDLQAAAAGGCRAVLFANGPDARMHPPVPSGLVSDPARLAPAVLRLLEAAPR